MHVRSDRLVIISLQFSDFRYTIRNKTPRVSDSFVAGNVLSPSLIITLICTLTMVGDSYPPCSGCSPMSNP